MIKLRDFIIPLWLLIVRKKKWKLHFIDLWCWADRNDLMIHILKESLDKDNIKDFVPVVINTGDSPKNKYFKLNVFAFTTSDEYYDRIIPDWTYDSWMECKIPKFEEITKDIIEAWKNQPNTNKIWRVWNFQTSNSRPILGELWNKYPQYLEIKDSYVKNPNNKEYCTLPDLVKKYKYLIDVEWNTYSARLKYLLFSGRPVFIQERKWKEYALIWAIPFKDYIPVKNDFSDLIEKIEKYFNSDLINKIWKNWQKFAIKKLNKTKAYEYIYKEFINIAKQRIKFNNCKIILFVLIVLSKQIYQRIRGTTCFFIKKLFNYTNI